MKFDMGRAWSEGVAKVSTNFSLLAILGGVFFFVPSVLMFVAMPDAMSFMTNPNMEPEDMEKIFANLGPSFFGIYLLVLIASLVGYAAMIALVGDQRRVSVGEAIAVGFKALLPLIAITVLLSIAYIILIAIVSVIIGLLAVAFGVVSTGLAATVTLVAIVAMVLALIWIMTRFSLVMPVLAIDRTMNPFTALGRSWRLTKPAQRRLFLFYVLLFVAYMVIAAVLFMIIGLIAAGIGAPSVLGFINGLIGALVAMLFSGIVAAIYHQLSSDTPQRLEETFD